MKQFLACIGILLSLISLKSCYIGGLESVTGNGKVLEKSRDVSKFYGVDVSSGIDVFIMQSEDNTVLVRADENLHDIIETRVSGDILRISSHKNIRSAKAKEVYVGIKELKEIKVSSSGDLIGEGPFNCKELKIKISSAGDVDLEVYANELKVDISSSGDADLKGRSDYLDASLSSAGDLKAFNLQTKVCRVKVSSAGNAEVYATDELDMNASSSGDIFYKGDARIVNMSASSAGKIIRY